MLSIQPEASGSSILRRPRFHSVRSVVRSRNPISEAITHFSELNPSAEPMITGTSPAALTFWRAAIMSSHDAKRSGRSTPALLKMSRLATSIEISARRGELYCMPLNRWLVNSQWSISALPPTSGSNGWMAPCSRNS